MPTIHVPLAERAYDIEIRSGALEKFQLEHSRAAVISNRTVAPLYADPLARKFSDVGTEVIRFNAPDGEAAKSLDVVSQAYDALAEGGLSRRDCVVAVGGGVVGDMAGFVAATWMRGVDFIQIPTTLLAMVDSSVGGKTGVNHPRAKNLLGAFYQPLKVVIDPRCLRTLPPRELRAGLAEVIKYGVIADREFFVWLEENLESALSLDEKVLETIIARSCEIKAQVVGEDERESDLIGRRAILNYGHTAGHAFEATTQYGQLLHGEAIAIGMTVAARIAIDLKTIDQAEGEDLLRRQTALFERAGLPISPPDIEFEALWDAMLLDKKTRAGAINFILPTELGHVELFSDVAPETVRAALEKCERVRSN